MENKKLLIFPAVVYGIETALSLFLVSSGKASALLDLTVFLLVSLLAASLFLLKNPVKEQAFKASAFGMGFISLAVGGALWNLGLLAEGRWALLAGIVCFLSTIKEKK